MKSNEHAFPGIMLMPQAKACHPTLNDGLFVGYFVLFARGGIRPTGLLSFRIIKVMGLRQECFRTGSL